MAENRPLTGGSAPPESSGFGTKSGYVTPAKRRLDDPAGLRGWRKRRAEARLIRLERQLRNLDKHKDWERSFDRWGPAQAAKYERDRAALIDRLNALCAALGVEHVYR